MTTFVGRRHELGRLGQLFDRGDAVLIVGLPAIGKRTLADAFLRERPDAQVTTLADAAGGTLVLADRWVEGWRGAVLRLGGLSREDALALWRQRDTACGVVPGFVAAWTQSGGHPGALLALHDGLEDAALADVIARLSPAARRTALALATFGGPVPRDHIEAADELTLALAVEVVGVGWVQLASPLAHPLARAATAEEREAARAAAEELAGSVAVQLLDPGCAAELGPRMVERAIARLPRDRRSPALRRARARALLDLGEAQRATAVVGDLPDDGSTRRLAAEIALRTGRVVAAARLDEEPDRALAADVAALRGLPLAEDAPARARAYAAWLRGDDVALEDATLEVRDGDPELRAFAAISAARHGDVVRARELVAALRSVAPYDEPRTALLARVAGAAIDEAEGRRGTALENLRELAARFAAAGELPFALALQLNAASLLFTIGHRREASVLVTTVERRARERGLHAGLAAAIDRAGAYELTRQVWRARPVEPSGPRAAALRQHAIAALQAAFTGHDLVADLHLAALAELPEGRDFAVERMLASLARGALARLGADDQAAALHLADAARHAASGGVDAEQLAALTTVLGRERLVSPRGRRLVGGTRAQIARRAVVIDAVSHEIRAASAEGQTRIDLHRRPVLARLLYALAARPGEELDKDALTIVLWGTEYNPLVHDNALKANVHRLNRMVAPARISIAFGSRGYRLHGPPELVLVDRPAARPLGVTASDVYPIVGSRAPEH